MATVAIENVTKTYPGGFQAVKGVSLDIADGEFVVLVGPSGCGKTTTLRMIAGLEDVTGGSISIGGRVVNDLHPKDRDIAMVFQNYALYPHMTVFENIAFSLKLRRVPKPEIKSRVDGVAKMLGIEGLLDRKPKALSGGQRQRVAVGRAIVREPKAFLFDEPLSNLDARLRVTTRGEIKALQHRLKTTTVYVTHDQEEAMTLGDRIVVMYGGLIQQVGSPLEVYRRPVNRFVAGFLGTPPMNFVDGTIVKGQGLKFSGEGMEIAVPETAATVALTGKPVALGVRPQGLAEGNAAGGALEGPVTLVEPLGDTMDVTLTLPSGRPIVARMTARDGLKAGTRVRLVADPAAVAVFEPGDLGRNVSIG
ncbi:MAG: ABC transporter ATP-binding protein [Phycisphaerales bacterium]